MFELGRAFDKRYPLMKFGSIGVKNDKVGVHKCKLTIGGSHFGSQLGYRSSQNLYLNLGQSLIKVIHI